MSECRANREVVLRLGLDEEKLIKFPLVKSTNSVEIQKKKWKGKKEIKWKQLPLFSITCKNKTERKMKWTIKIKNKREREKNLISFSDRSLLLAQLHLGFNIQRECTVRWLTGVRGVPKLHVRSYSQCAHHVSYIYLDYVHSTNLWRHALDWNLVCYEK